MNTPETNANIIAMMNKLACKMYTLPVIIQNKGTWLRFPNPAAIPQPVNVSPSLNISTIQKPTIKKNPSYNEIGISTTPHSPPIKNMIIALMNAVIMIEIFFLVIPYAIAIHKKWCPDTSCVPPTNGYQVFTRRLKGIKPEMNPPMTPRMAMVIKS